MNKAMKILLAVDGSQCSMDAVEEAARIRWPEGSIVEFVSVAEDALTAAQWMMPIPSGNYEVLERVLADNAISNTMQAMKVYKEIAEKPIEMAARTLKGDPKLAILEEASRWKANLIILGTHGHNSIERLWLGSVSRYVATHANCSVHMARRRNIRKVPPPPLTMLLAVDNSKYSEIAVNEIINRPWHKGDKVHIISVVHLPFHPTPENWDLPESEYFQLEKSKIKYAKTAINQALSKLQDSNLKREAPLNLTGEVIVGQPEVTIIAIAKKMDADLIILGSRGQSTLKKFLLGSVSYGVSSHAPCSVEIVRGELPS